MVTQCVLAAPNPRFIDVTEKSMLCVVRGHKAKDMISLDDGPDDPNKLISAAMVIPVHVL